jgi:hypothetical protein
MRARAFFFARCIASFSIASKVKLLSLVQGAH